MDEQVGVLVKAERSLDTQLLARLAMPATPLTFEQVLHLLEAGVQTATPSGAGPYTYTYAIPTGNTVNTIKTYTVEAFNAVADADYREMAYGFVEEFTFEFSAGEPWQMSGSWVGRQVVTGTPTSLSTLLSVEEALGMKTKLYIDASGGTIGTTQKTGVLMGAQMRVKTGLVPVMVGDGQLYFSTHKFVEPEISFSLTLELETTSHVNAERTAYEAKGTRLFRLDCPGSTANRNFQLDWAGTYDSIDGYTNSNGNTTVTLNGHGVYSSGDALLWSCVVKNNLASIA